MRVCVIGFVNQDHVLRVPSIPAPGETVVARGVRRHPGGKGANQAVAAARLGARVRLVACVGDDGDGARLLEQLRAEGVDTTDVDVVPGRPTGTALVAVDPRGENSIVVVPGANLGLSGPRVSAAVRRSGRDTLVVLQAEAPSPIILAAVEAADAVGARVVLNLSPYTVLPAEVLASCDPLVLNESEAAALLGHRLAGVAETTTGARDLTARARSVVITLGASGAVWATEGSSGAVPARAAGDVVDTTGAGDAFAGAMCARLASGGDLRSAVELGVLAGGVAVTREGAQSSYPTRAEIDASATGHGTASPWGGAGRSTADAVGPREE